MYIVLLASHEHSTLEAVKVTLSHAKVSGHGAIVRRSRRIVVRVAAHGGELKKALEAGERGTV